MNGLQCNQVDNGFINKYGENIRKPKSLNLVVPLSGCGNMLLLLLPVMLHALPPPFLTPWFLLGGNLQSKHPLVAETPSLNLTFLHSGVVSNR